MLKGLANGCPKLKTYKMDDVNECMCGDYAEYQVIKKEAQLRAAKAAAAKEASKNVSGVCITQSTNSSARQRSVSPWKMMLLHLHS